MNQPLPCPPPDLAAPPGARGLLALWRRLQKLAPYFAGTRMAWLLAIAATVAVAITEALIPAFFQPLFDQGFAQRTMPLWMVPAVFIGIFAVRGTAQFLSQYALSWIANEGTLRLRMALFGRVIEAELGLFSRESASSLSNTVVYEVQTGSTMLVQTLLGLSRDGFTLLALLGYLLYLNWKLTLIIAVLFPLVAWIIKSMSRRLYLLTRASQETVDEMAYVVEQNVLAHRMVRLHHAQAQQVGRFAEVSQRLRRLSIKAAVAGALMTPLTQMVAAVALSLVVMLALHQAQQPGAAGPLSIGQFIAFVTALLMLVAPMKRISDVGGPVTRGIAAVERGIRMLEGTPVETGGNYRGKDAAPGQHRPAQAIALEGVSVAYGKPDDGLALDGVSLQIAAGTTVALVGPSGAGKTTLVNLLPRFVKPSGGSVRVDGVDVAQWDLQALRQNIAMVSQDVVMFNDSIAANVALGQTIERERVRRALEGANLLDHVQALPQGMDTRVGHNASTLSGGQRQRLAIARALYKDAPILILDEATSALDNQSERLVQQALAQVMRGRTTLVIAHRLSTIEHASHVVVMEHGRVVEQGSHAQLLAADGLYAQLHRQGQRSGTLPD